MASKIKVDQILGSTGDVITVPTGQTLTVTDGIPVASGGTGIASFTAGDILYATGATTLTKLNKGTAEQVLAMNSGETAPDWGSVDLTVLPTITVAKGGTNIASFTAGDILYATGATTLTKLAKGAATNVLTMNAGETAPEWAAAAAGGAWTKIKTITLDGSETTAVSFINGTDSVVMDSTYSTYKIITNGISMYDSTDGNYMRCQVYDGGTDGASETLVTGSVYKWSNYFTDSNTSNTVNAGNNVAYMQVMDASQLHDVTGQGVAFELTLYNSEQVAADTCFKMMSWSGQSIPGAGTYSHNWTGGGLWTSASNKVRGLKFFPAAGGWREGRFILYGIA